MRTWIRPLLIFVIVVVIPLPAWSVIIRTKEGKEYKGHFVKKDFLKVTFRPLGSKEEMSLFNADVAEISQSVNLQLLEKLKPAEPKEYYEYALGLMAKQDDPEAQETALRLFVIAAYLEPVTYGFNALMKMSEIARTAEEASSFRAMAFLLDAVSDKNTLKKTSLNGGEDAKAREAFLKSLEMLRRGKTKDALSFGEVKGVADYFAVIPGLMTYPDFVKLCKDHPECTACTEGRIFCVKCQGKGGVPVGGGKVAACQDCKTTGFTLCKICKGKPRQVKISPLQLQIILQLELLNETDPKAKLDAPAEVKSEKWSALLGGSQIRPIPVLSLIHLTEFDPRKSVFKNGKWVEP